ncbi:MAG: hypothetical protein K8R68_04525, partial [Bacteroidales bacterium]|nr:hypothetical protein [Bacteroidales bacterium]
IDFKGEQDENYLVSYSVDWLPQIKIDYDAKANNKKFADEIINVAEFIGVKSPKAKGKRLTTKVVKKIEFIEPLPYDEPEESADSKEDLPNKTKNIDIEKPELPEATKKQKEEVKEENTEIKKKKQSGKLDEDETKQMELEF